MKHPIFFLLFTAIFASEFARADWPQWRGPLRNGTVSEALDLPDEWTEESGPTKKWESTEVPSDHYGGHGSVSVADGKVFLSVVWHSDEPTETRQINSDVLSKLGYRGTSKIPPEVLKDMEEQRKNLSRRLRGAALDDFAQKWVEDNLDKKTQMSLGSWITSRFKKGKAAIGLEVYDQLNEVKSKVFEGQEEMEAWVKEQKFDPSVERQIIEAVPATKKVATDVVLALDAETGEEAWKFEVPGYPSGRGSSSTPAFADGKVFAALSEGIYCVDAKTGKQIWKSELTRRGPASSPLVAEGKVFIQANVLTGYDAATGEKLWENKDAKGANQSPSIWKGIVICNGAKEVVGVNSATGETMWTAPGGGDGTPVISGDHLVISSKTDGKNIIAYELAAEGPKELWSQDFLARRYGSSPIIHDGHVYHLGSERHICFDLKTGDIKWERQAQSSISSPFLADGKIFVYENRGGFLAMIKATPEDYTPLGRSKVGALYCASPAISNGNIYLRTKENVACFSLK